MPINGAFHGTGLTSHEEAKGLRAVRWVETQAMLGRQRCRAITVRRWMTIALPHRIHDANANRGMRNCQLDTGPTYHRRCFARELQRAPPIRDHPWGDAHRDDFGGPAEPRNAQ